MLLQLHFILVSITDTNESGEHIGWRYFQLGFHDVVLFV